MGNTAVGRARALRRILGVAVPSLMIAALLAVSASAVDTSSTSGVRIVTIPFGTSMDAVAIVDDTIGLQGDSGIWPGSGLIFKLRTDLPAGATNITIEDMNASGDVVGSYKIAGVPYAYMWSPTNGHASIPAPAAMVADPNIFEATGISDDGWVVGIYQAEANTCGHTAVNPCGFLATPDGSSYTVTTFTGQPVYSYFGVSDIELVTVGATNAHVAVGFGLVWSDDDPGNPWHLLDKGTFTGIDALDVNRNGEIAGHAYTTDVVGAFWPSPVAPLTVLDPLAGDTVSYAFALNDAGTIVGFSGPNGVEGTAVYWTGFAPGANDLGHVDAGTTFSIANAISEQGIIVGQSGGDAVLWDVVGDYEVGAVIEIDPIADEVVEPGAPIDRTFTWSGTPGFASPSSLVMIHGGTPGINPILYAATDSSVSFNWFAPTEPGAHEFTFEVLSPYLGVPGATETFTLTVAPSTGPVSISITETVGVSDSVTVTPPVMIEITEAVGVSDGVAVRPPVVISITESVGVSDRVAVTPPVVISITEAVGVSDGVVVTPPVVITIAEAVGVGDTIAVTPEALGAISGMKWEDLNGDGTLDIGEPSIEGITIFLDLNDDALPSPGEPSTLTAADGSYEFTGLAPGDWVVREVVPGGYVQTFPTAAVEGEHRVTVTGADTVIDVDFGNSAEAIPAPVIQPIDDVVVDVGEYVEIGFVLEGSPDPALYSHEWTGYPPTALINGVIPYTPLPEQAGMEYEVTLTVTAIDDPAVFDTETFSIHVNELNQPATIAPISDAFGVPGEDIVVELDINDPEGDAYTKIWTGHPPNALLNGIFILNPTSEQAGEAFPIALDIVQGGQVVATETFTVFVGEVPGDPAGAPGITLPPGGGIQVTGGGFEPETGIGIFLFSDPILLGTANADEFGTFSTVVQIPNGIDPGLHTIVVMGTAAGGGTRSLAGPIEISPDPDQDGLTTAEETLTGTDPSMTDTDGDGLVDGTDPTWLRSYLSQLPSDAFKSRFTKALLTYRVAWLHAAVSLGERNVALYLISSIERRANGCGSSPDRNDWIRDCDTQAEFGELLGLLKRNISVMELPDPPRWWE